MKIWFPTIKAGTGADTFVERLARGLNIAGVDTEITWFNHYLEFFPYLLKLVKPSGSIDIIHANSWYGFAFNNKNNKLIVSEFHCVHDPEFKKHKSILQKIYHNLLIYRYEKSSVQKADAIAVISKHTCERLKEIFPNTKTRLIYCGIDANFFTVSDKVSKDNTFNLLFIGSQSRRKGFDLLLPIMNKLGNNFNLYYTGEYRNELHKNNKNIYNLGRLDKQGLLNAYQNCGAFLFPTRYEGFGYTVCEAMSCGRPVITSNCSSLPELVIQDETGFLCEVNNVDAFCEAARQLAASPELAKKMGRAGRERVLANFTIEKMVDEYIELYESLL